MVENLIQTKRLTIAQAKEAPGFAVNEDIEDLAQALLIRLQTLPDLSELLADHKGVMDFCF